MRGKVRALALTQLQCGITPAHAGKRSRAVAWAARMKDHPRPCGEKTCWSRCLSSTVGSPPPMRGKVDALGKG